MDMDGVLVKGIVIIPSTDSLFTQFKEQLREYRVLTNNSMYSQRDLNHCMSMIGYPSAGDYHIHTGDWLLTAEPASGQAPIFVGKPNPLMIRLARNHIDGHSEDTVMVCNRMDTDILTGVESDIRLVETQTPDEILVKVAAHVQRQLTQVKFCLTSALLCSIIILSIS